MSYRKGFTLIELLVVIAIIAILAAILFPVFLSAKARTQQAACLQNMKQIGTALTTYLGDWNDAYPMNRFQDPLMPVGQRMDGTRFNWKTVLTPYIRTRGDVWRCVSNYFANKGWDETGTAVAGQVAVPQYPISYALCGDFFNNLGANFSLPLRKLSAMRSPSKQIFVLESRFSAPDLGSGMLNYDYSTSKVAGHAGWGWMQSHQSGRSNFLFADCHARALKVPETMTPRSMWTPWPNQSQYDALSRKLAPEYY